MSSATDNSDSCKIRAVTFFFYAKVINASVYGENLTNGGTVRQWCRMSKNGRSNRCSLRKKKC
jgi:hypothetical protein